MESSAAGVLAFKCLVLLLAMMAVSTSSLIIEEERLVEYHKRNYTWPLPSYVPTTPGWKALMDARFEQVAAIEDLGKRYEGYIQVMRSAYLVPNFTEYGFGLAKCPDPLLQALQKGIHDGLPTARHENRVEVIDAPEQPLFIDRPDLTQRVLNELHSFAEAWSGIELTPYTAYGFRLYQNQSQLMMHVDKMQTHIISYILHIDSSEDAEPWPIFIEDLHGRTHEVVLTPGDILFYESSKCFHGRPRRFNGSWYTSVFVHYYPKDGWAERDHKMEAHYAIPPEWRNPPPAETRQPQLAIIGTSLKEPGCPPEDWCRANEAMKWSGPAEPDVWIDPNFVRHPFHPKMKHDEL